MRQTKCAVQKSGDFHFSVGRPFDECLSIARLIVRGILKGRKILAPHLHVKLATPFKDPKEGEQEPKRIIDTALPELKEITQ